MTSAPRIPGSDADRFIAAVRAVADSLGWQLRSFTRDSELIAVVALENDMSYEQALWVYDTKEASLRCLLVCRASIPPEREGAVLELCARINDGLSFGCLEYGFADGALSFRDSADLRHGSLAGLVTSTTTRLLSLGSRYSAAIRATLAGSAPGEAIARAESVNGA